MMDNRSRKREELSDQLPADKRVCSSADVIKPGSSNSSVQTQMNSTSESPDCEMEATSSSASVSGRSEGDVEKDYSSGSDDMDDSDERHRSIRAYYNGRLSVDQGKIRKIVSSLEEKAGPDSQLAALTELCDVLSFSAEELPSSSANLLAPLIVTLAKDGNNPDVILLSVRCITYLCESSEVLVQHDVVPALCARLLNIEYLDVAEQCLQALEKISREHPLACLEAGVIMAALNYIDFFCTSIQRVALSTVANICKELPSDRTSPLMEAVPILCNLLQYEDQKLVESVAICLIQIVDRVKHSSEMLDGLCKHGLIHQAVHHIELNGRSPLSQSVYIGLIGLLSKLASGSVAAVRTLLELNISSMLKNILSSYDHARGMPSFVVSGEQSNQVHEFMKLLNELLPPLPRNIEDALLTSDKEKILGDQPELLQQFGVNILPVMIEVVSSGVNLYVCYCCLSIINKLVYFSEPDMLLEFLKNTNISSFLAGAFTRKDRHVLILVLEIVENITKKLPGVFLESFIKEGVVYAIDALLTPESCSEFSFPMSSSIKISSGSNHKAASKDVPKCLCYAFDVDQSPLSSDTSVCKLKEDCVTTLAKHIKVSYFATESQSSGIGLTETLQKLRNLSALLTDEVLSLMNKEICDQQEENLSHILSQILAVLSAGEYMSTFEFIESGIVKSLVTYLSNCHYIRGEINSHSNIHSFNVILKRLEMFARFSLSATDRNWEGMPIAVLIKKLQSALASLEDFPVILSHVAKPRNTHATIPFGRSTLTPSLKVHFVRQEGEMGLSDFTANVVTVEPFSTLNDIEKYLLPKVSTQRAEHLSKLVGQSTDQLKDLTVQGSFSSPKVEDQNVMQTNSSSSEVANVEQDGRANVSTPTAECQTPVTVEGDQQHPHADTSSKLQDLVNATTSNAAVSKEDCKEGGSTSYTSKDASPKLIFYLKGKPIDRELTFYQAILQQKFKEEHDVVVGTGFWNEVYEVAYGKAAEPKSKSQECFNGPELSSARDNYTLWQNVPFFRSLLVSELRCGLEKSDLAYEILFLLKILEGVNRFAFNLMSQVQRHAFSSGEKQDLENLVVIGPTVPPTEFVNIKLTEKLEQQMRDPLAVSTGSMPSWCNQLMITCPFLFGFDARCKYFRQVVCSSSQGRYMLVPQAVNNSVSPARRNSHASGIRRKKFQVCRSDILNSATKMMDQHARQKAVLEVEYDEEVGSGLGPTMEFYTLVSHGFQKVGLCMWRGDYTNLTVDKESIIEDSGIVLAPLGLFPRPLSSLSNSFNELRLVEVIKKFVLLGQIVAKALQDGRVLDLFISKAFYKLILEQELNIYDIHSIDPELGRTLLEFQALIDRKKASHSGSELPFISYSCFRNTRIEDLWLDFTLPGYPDYMLSSGDEHKMVNFSNLEEYVSSIVDATVKSGISRQVEAFRSGFNQVFPLKNLQIFTEVELERLLCGEQDAWTSNELLEHIKFDHGYTASSPPIINLLEIIQEIDYDQKRAFLQFVTGAPRLPPGGLAALNPQLTVVRKHCSECADGDLPSVMTCANYLKLPPYSSKERMRERLLFAITEGQGSFHLS
ncbi:E3 ubiquitin-protein ligase [Thalictrum thalictroides]|uniref:HECT-type E3 ubiquitin transferase n=1 Tax=Thalictrum thalictroides TaxID=46969 RepID=A0A7J6VUA0_THATH|nr:E3 ubiquitin-protein ligase [Thalictrum thalictroides]